MLVDLYAAPYTAAALITTTVLALLYGRERTKAKGPRARTVRLPGGEKCVVSGVALGLPGTRRRVFDPSNFAVLREGTNLLEKVDAAGVKAMLRRNVARLRKEHGKATKLPITEENGIAVSARLGVFDLSRDYGVPEPLVKTMGRATQLAVAAGLECMKDAGLIQSVDGQLPESLRDGTGIIYATSFPALDAAVGEISKYGDPRRRPTSELLDALAARVDPENQDLQAALHLLRAKAQECQRPYAFDRKFLFKVLCLANSQLAQLVKARGPNLQTNAACAGTTQAVALAQDLIRAGRCDRVVVVSGDDASGDALMPWVGNGFAALGAASIAKDASSIARPFDKRRSGMVVGAGACGLVIERASSVGTRQRRARCRVVESLVSNSAFHGAAMCATHIASELEAFLQLVERKHGIPRSAIARGVYLSHETGTHATPSSSCAHNEVQALRACFGDDLNELRLVNTKALTGHPMAVGVEDAVAAYALSRNVSFPPRPPNCVADPNLGSALRFADRRPARYALRFAAGFGSQVAFVLYASA